MNPKDIWNKAKNVEQPKPVLSAKEQWAKSKADAEKKKVSFFLRFYALPKEKVADLIVGEYKKMFPALASFTIEPITQSVNMAVPKNSWEVLLEFQNETERNKAYNSPFGKAWYMKQVKIPGAKFALQTHKAKAYKSPLKYGKVQVPEGVDMGGNFMGGKDGSEGKSEFGEPSGEAKAMLESIQKNLQGAVETENGKPLEGIQWVSEAGEVEAEVKFTKEGPKFSSKPKDPLF